MTAEEAVVRIEEHFGSAWSNTGVDGFKAGDPKTNVTGIATAWTPSLEVLQQAVKARQNLVITLQPPFWAVPGSGGRSRWSSRLPNPSPAPAPGRGGGGPPALTAENTDLYAHKKKYIEDHNLVLWRFSENWQNLPGQYRLRGLASVLGWQRYEDAKASEGIAPVGAGMYALPATPLQNLADTLKRNQGWNAIRVLGDPASKISRVALRPGYLTVPDAIQMVRDTKVDAVVCGESCEWEAFPYFADWVTSGWGKAFIMLGYAASEDPGSQSMAAWLKRLFPEVGVAAIACGEPFRIGKA